MSTLTWSEALPADAPALLVLMEQFYIEEHLAFDHAGTGEALRGLLADPAWGRAYLLQDDDEPRGYLVLTLGYSLEFHGRYATLDELYLIPDWRRRGIGRDAIEFAARVAKNELNVKTLRLEVTNHNQKARRLYERCGFYDDDRGAMTRWLDDTST